MREITPTWKKRAHLRFRMLFDLADGTIPTAKEIKSQAPVII